MATGRHVVTLGDERYIFDERELRNSDAFAIKSASGLNLGPFMKGINDGDPAALQALVWFLRQKNGRPEDIHHVDFLLADLTVDDDEDEPDPTAPEPAETSSGTAETATSGSSPTTAT